MSFWVWLPWRKPKTPKPTDDAEAVRLALAELGRRHEYKKKRGWLREQKVEADRQVVIDGKGSTDISGELLTLTTDTYLNRRLYGSDEKQAQDLSHVKGGAQAATTASADALAEMRKKGIKPREHYYRLAERQQMGEIQETFLIDELESGPPKSPKEPDQPAKSE